MPMKHQHRHHRRRHILVAERAAPVSRQLRFLDIGREMYRQVRHQPYSEIADRQQHQCGDAEPAHQFVLGFRQQRQRRRHGDDARRQGEALDRGGGVQRQHDRRDDPAAEQEIGRRQQGREAAHVVAHRERDRQHGDDAEYQIGQRLVAGGGVLELLIAEIDERPQRHPGQEQRADERRAAHQVHHLLTPQFSDDGAQSGGGGQFAQDTIFEAL